MPSVRIRFADRSAVEQAVRAYAENVRRQHPEVERIIWFGSWVNGIPVPGSDVDLCLVLSHSDRPVRERIPRYLPVGFPVGLDLFPYTRSELVRLEEDSPEWFAAIVSGREL